jgi:hypothetical protein
MGSWRRNLSDESPNPFHHGGISEVCRLVERNNVTQMQGCWQLHIGEDVVVWGWVILSII